MAAPKAPEVLRERLVEALPELEGSLELTFSPSSRRYLATFAPRPGLDARVAGALGLQAPPSDEARPRAARALAGLQGVLPLGALARETATYAMGRSLVPRWLRPFWTGYNVAPFVFRGLASLAGLRIDADVLDGAALAAAFARRDYATAGTVAYLLKVGVLIEEAAVERAREDLTSAYAPSAQPVWVERNGRSLQIPYEALRPGEHIVARAGSEIPVDGTVLEGVATVNESMMTGEMVAVGKRRGSTVWAGTVVEEGRLLVHADKVGDGTRRAQIAAVLAEAAGLKSETQTRAKLLADKLAPLTFLGSGLIYLLTGDAAKAVSVLLVDYSCAVKLCGPLAVNAALIEATRHGALVKGGRYVEELANADIVVLDKTGTLTRAEPSVAEVVSYSELSREEVLRQAACLEEHFPHPVARAVVHKAEQEELHHEERHSEVEYIVAHGIASSLEGHRILVGSRHFVEEDEGVDVSAGDSIVEAWGARGLSALYVAWGGRLAGVIAIDDPIHDDAPAFVRALHELGLEAVMVTGDSERAARTVATELGLDRFHAQVLPDDKARIVRELKAEGRHVAVIGDGMNDSAALAYADVGVCLDHGADLAQQAANVVLLQGNLDGFVRAREISERLQRRITRQFSIIIGANTAFLAMALMGAPAALVALLHNGTTVLTSAMALRQLLDEAAPDAPEQGFRESREVAPNPS